MSLINKQREALLSMLGAPALSLEFDVWPDGNVSMWTHLNHAADYAKTRADFIAIRDHLNSFIAAEAMCPFHKEKP